MSASPRLWLNKTLTCTHKNVHSYENVHSHFEGSIYGIRHDMEPFSKVQYKKTF